MTAIRARRRLSFVTLSQEWPAGARGGKKKHFRPSLQTKSSPSLKLFSLSSCPQASHSARALFLSSSGRTETWKETTAGEMTSFLSSCCAAVPSSNEISRADQISSSPSPPRCTYHAKFALICEASAPSSSTSVQRREDGGGRRHTLLPLVRSLLGGTDVKRVTDDRSRPKTYLLSSPPSPPRPFAVPPRCLDRSRPGRGFTRHGSTRME